MLTLTQVELLKSPLPIDAGHSARVKGEAKPDAKNQWAQWLIYTEEEPVIDRLNEVDPSWTFTITDKVISGVGDKTNATIYGRLTVCGVSRDCVGTGTQGDAEKGAATDALKRGARLFGIGLYLKQAPLIYTSWAPKEQRTREQVEKWEHEALAKFAAWYRQQFPPVPAPNGHEPDSELDEYLGPRESEDAHDPERETPPAAGDTNGYDPRTSTDLLTSITWERAAAWYKLNDPRITAITHASNALKRGLFESGKIPEDATWKDIYAKQFTLADAYRAIENHYDLKAAQASA
jgi:hypothetical protein